MKHTLVVAVAVLSLVAAIPLSHRPATQPRRHAFHVKPAHAVASVKLAPKPLPPVATYSVTGGCEQYLPLVKKYDWDASTAMAIMQAESTVGTVSCDSQAVGTASYDGVADYGLMQLHGIDILDPAQNIEYAYHHKYLTQGWHAWSTYNNGKYLQYLR